jgi:hypothetical protein
MRWGCLFNTPLASNKKNSQLYQLIEELLFACLTPDLVFKVTHLA